MSLKSVGSINNYSVFLWCMSHSNFYSNTNLQTLMSSIFESIQNNESNQKLDKKKRRVTLTKTF